MRTSHVSDPEPESPDESRIEASLRPSTLGEYVGQSALKENLSIFISAAKKRGEALDHCLFLGPPGLGKTTLANVIAREMGAQMRTTAGPVIQKAGDLAAILTNLQEGDVLFIDEIHRLNPAVEEILYPAMEDFRIDIVIGQGPAAKSINLTLPPFTLVGATTRAGLITSPLRERFGITHRLDFYSTGELMMILRRSARILGVPLEDDGASEMASRSRGTPRIANRLLRRVRDFAEVKGGGVITRRVADDALSMLEVDKRGLDKMDRQLLSMIADVFGGGPVGIETLASALHEAADTIEDVYEPYLIQEGFIQRTPRGRVATESAFEHLGIARKTKPGKSQELPLG